VTLDVFLESDEFEREEAERALAQNGVAAESAVSTSDGGEASVSIDDDGVVFVVRTLTPELAQVLFDVARAAELAILPADGTPNALIVDEGSVPDDLDAIDVASVDELYEALRRSEEMRGARSA